jgi:acetyl-CoA C-acetyltransferase
MSGHYENVLVIGAEKMTHLPTKESTKILAKVIDPKERMYGASMPALAAMVTRLYMEKFDLSQEELAQVAVKNHKNGTMNPYAHFQEEIAAEDVLTSRMIADPLRLYDCSPMSDGACALILTPARGDVRVTGLGQGTDTISLSDRKKLTSFKSTKIAASKAYKMADIFPQDIDCAELHDAFTSFEIISSEDLGFFGEGEGGNALSQGITSLNGDLPINPSGGLKARGHPVGASGLAQIIEIFWQLTKNAGKRQVDKARVGLTQSTGGLGNNNFVTILEAC